MIGGLIGGALGVGGAIFGNISASKAIKKARQGLERERAENEDWYNRNYNEDATQRAVAQRVLSKTYDSVRERNRQAAGTQAVMGGTEESVAAAKAANNEAIADAASQIAAAGERRKDEVERQYQERKSAVDGALRDIEVGKAANVKQSAAALAKAGASIADALDPVDTDSRGEAAGYAGAGAKKDKYSIMDDALWMDGNGYA